MGRTAPRERAESSETALILAAERLFAERGIEAVALRQINQAANQKNMSAAHYHFGSREGLIRAVLEHRWPALDRRRAELLRREGSARDMRFFLEAFILPLSEELVPRAEGNHYIRFMQQYERQAGDYREIARELTPAGIEIYAGIEALLGEVPEAVRRLRIGYLINVIHSVLARAEERLSLGEIAPQAVALITANLIDMCAGALTAPLSDETLDLTGTAGPTA